MSFRTTLPVLFATAALCASATTISFSGPTEPVIGDPFSYDIFGAQLTQPNAGNPDWTLAIETNYPVTLPGNPDLIPNAPFGSGGSFTIGDFLMTWNSNSYAVVLTPHDGFQAGDLYEASGFQTSGDIVGLGVSPRPFEPVWLAATNALLLGDGTLSVAKTGDGITAASYTITDVFSAPTGFLTPGDFTIDMTSYACANGVMSGGGNFVPEPGTLLLVMPVLLVFGRRHARRRRL